MAIKTHIYKPNKNMGLGIKPCTCEVEISWDDSVDLDQRVHSLVQFHNKCVTHGQMSEDNAFKNILRGTDTSGTWDVLSVMRGSYDTCECKLNVMFDKIEAQKAHEEAISHALHGVANSGTGEGMIKCSAHQGLANAKTVVEAVLDENLAKNKALELIKAGFASQTKEVVQDDGTTIIDFKAGFEPQWEFTEDIVGKGRVVKINAPQMSGQERAQLKTQCDDTLGPGKVVITP